ncbi:hypothetical protein QZM46_29655 [Burkholderia vietnamiensis]|uniref:Uncharacterized protein n=1 Tax=Burkholderia vietnamiensis TaxID=60552 RepID=A0AA44XV91_BURVI|nr:MULTISPECIES: hypothetical protein [Burkholderia]AOK42847.1 hypothetical protein WL96_17015 [Burkholderia vietnamiensis]KVS10545.1 hypothetical protein WK32_05110 [Burkholderia vietnamiensis]MBE0630349.1 hypothetical protein [Burkholderia vietnamiensis]MBR8081214.1 hypothetical protein [Burkholderia vietnamiensis]MBR8355934.1 hypothetical protein [Burkholderia vietnamiensis]
MSKIKELLKSLATCEPYRPTKALSLERARKASALFLGSSGFCFLLLLILAGWHKLAPADWQMIPAITFYVSTVVLSLLSLVVEPIVGIMLMFRWKQDALDTLTREIETDEKNVRVLNGYADDTLKYAQHCLQLKVKRLDARVVSFFGSGAAAYALLAVTFTNIKDAGGLPWLRNTLANGFVSGNFINTAILWGIALIFGLSVGAMMVRRLQSRFVYQLDLIELALLRRTLETAGKNT